MIALDLTATCSGCGDREYLGVLTHPAADTEARLAKFATDLERLGWTGEDGENWCGACGDGDDARGGMEVKT